MRRLGDETSQNYRDFAELDLINMPQSLLRLIKHAVHYREQSEINCVPWGTRGFYVLYQRKGRVSAESHHYDVVYIGMARNNIRGRLKAHRRNRADYWSHFSAFEVWDNIRDEEIEELEGLFRNIYRWDSKANILNAQKSYKKLNQLAPLTKLDWEID